jgi:hypothetical protein
VAWPIVLDACVLVPGGLRDDLLSVAEAAIYQPVWSSGILIEVDRTLRDRFKLTAAQTAYLLGEIRRAFPNAEVEDWESRLGWVPEAVEAEDRHVVAAALKAEAKIIVTANVRHFAPTEVSQAVGIEIKRPDDFLVDQWTIAPRAAAAGVRRQIGRLNRTAEEHVEAVRQRLPRYGELLGIDIAFLLVILSSARVAYGRKLARR